MMLDVKQTVGSAQPCICHKHKSPLQQEITVCAQTELYPDSPFAKFKSNSKHSYIEYICSLSCNYEEVITAVITAAAMLRQLYKFATSLRAHPQNSTLNQSSHFSPRQLQFIDNHDGSVNVAVDIGGNASILDSTATLCW